MPRCWNLLIAALALSALFACGFNPKESGGRNIGLGRKGTLECLYAGCHDAIASTSGASPGFIPSRGWALGRHANGNAAPSTGDPDCNPCHDPVEDLADAAYLFTDPVFVPDTVILDETLVAVGRTVRPLVGCEACHGTAAEHYAYAGTALYYGIHRLPLASTVGPIFSEPLNMLTCVPCHSPDMHAGGATDQDLLANQSAEWRGVDGTGLLGEDGHAETILVETDQGLMTSVVRGIPCAACHTTEGFVRFFARADTSWASSQVQVDRLIVDTADADLADPPRIPGPSARSQVTCVSCHPSHEAGRLTRQILLDGLAAQDDTQLRANLCIACHNGRGLTARAGAGFSSIGSLEVPRHPQREVFFGTAGSAHAFTVLSNSSHAGTLNIPGACTGCHYIVRRDVSLSAYPLKATSGHRFVPRLEGCLDSTDPSFTGCHLTEELLLSGSAPFSYVDTVIGSFSFASVLATPAQDHDGDGFYEPFQVEVDGLLAALRSRLAAAGAPRDEASGLFDLTQMASQDGTTRAAAYNYDYVVEDGSRGLHNPRYVVGVLKGSISAFDHP